MVLFPAGVSGTIRACLLALLIVQVRGFVSEQQVADKDLEWDKKAVKEHVGGVDTDMREAEHAECMKDLSVMVGQYLSAKARHEGMTKAKWLSQNQYRFDEETGNYVLGVRGQSGALSSKEMPILKGQTT